MPEVTIAIGGREFAVVCQEGEQNFLTQAAQLLDAEASLLGDQLGRMPETRMLLMAGLMLADKAAGLEEQMRALEEKSLSQQAMIEELSSRPATGQQVVPQAVTDTLAELTARAEAIADALDEPVR
ncbi:MAG: cell division protein ZapA [Rhodobacteraceae bacterium]|nr:cell division protein ZapA [Paracoccaceae bacterium]